MAKQPHEFKAMYGDCNGYEMHLWSKKEPIIPDTFNVAQVKNLKAFYYLK